ncbi:hypothetical protein C1N87_31795 (plasmid) [Priestia aryabhattai]
MKRALVPIFIALAMFIGSVPAIAEKDTGADINKEEKKEKKEKSSKNQEDKSKKGEKKKKKKKQGIWIDYGLPTNPDGTPKARETDLFRVTQKKGKGFYAVEIAANGNELLGGNPRQFYQPKFEKLVKVEDVFVIAYQYNEPIEIYWKLHKDQFNNGDTYYYAKGSDYINELLMHQHYNDY